MLTISDIYTLKRTLLELKKTHNSIGFVPTMGNLHDGHLTLIKRAHQLCDVVICSIFINPMQFNNNNDLQSYPKTLDHDQLLLKQEHCHILFTPNHEEIYTKDSLASTYVTVPDLSEGLCGSARPGHFNGVSTVLTILFNLIQADHVFLGEKDFQQISVIKKMVNDLHIPTNIHSVPTVRDKNGLALSSRNTRLSLNEQKLASHIFKSLNTLIKEIQSTQNIDIAIAKTHQVLSDLGFKVDYINVLRPNDLKHGSINDKELIAFIAVFLNGVRLIDNLPFSLNRSTD
jgi:pantoate--beta-alanine ligase